MRFPSPLPMLRRLDREAGVTIASRFVVLIAGIVTSVVTARLLGPDGRGLYFYMITLAGFVTQFGNLGFPSANTYVVAREPHKLGSLTTNSLWLTGATFVIAAAILALSVGQEDTTLLLLILAAALGSANLMFMLMSNLFVGLQRILHFNAFQIGSNLLTLFCIVGVAFIFNGVAPLLAASVVATIVSALLALWVLVRGQPMRPALDFGVLGPAMKYSLRAFCVTLLGFVVLRGSVLVLERFAGNDELGYYSIAAQLADVVAILPTSFALVIMPRLVRQDVGRFEMAWRQTAFVAGLMLFVCGGAALIASPFIYFAFGQEYMQAVPIFYWMLPGSFFLGVSSMISQYLAAIGLPLKTIFVWLATTLCLFLAAAFLVPKYQALGAAVALSISHAVLFALLALTATVEARRERDQALSKPIPDISEIPS